MSINSITNAAAARRADLSLGGNHPATFRDWSIASQRTVADAARSYASVSRPAGPEVIQGTQVPPPPSAASPQKAQGSSVDTALHVIFGFIPTEILTLYVAVLAVLQSSAQIGAADWITFGIFLFLTPAVVWAVFAAKIKGSGKALPLKPTCWPFWEMFAALVAFATWAFALPHSPFASFPWYSAALSGVMVLVVSTVLALIAPLVQRPLSIS